MAERRAFRLLLEGIELRVEAVNRVYMLKRDLPLLQALEDDVVQLEAGLRGQASEPARLLAYHLDLVELEEIFYAGGEWLEAAKKMIPAALIRMQREVMALERLRNSQLGGQPFNTDDGNVQLGGLDIAAPNVSNI